MQFECTDSDGTDDATEAVAPGTCCSTCQPYEVFCIA